MTPNPSLRIPLVWITGASTGIGRATALELVRQGRTVVASARSKDKLQSLVQEAITTANRAHDGNMGGRIIPLPLDVTDSKAVADAVNMIETKYGYIDLALLNAGGWDKREAGALSLSGFMGTYDLNVYGAVRVLEALLPLMRQRRRGHIAITASVAGYGGLPDAYGYTSGKAALINLAESLAIDLANDNIKVQVINPGFVKTPLTAPNQFPMPFLLEADDAARRIAKGLNGNRFEITFPWQLVLPMKLLRLLPHKVWISAFRFFMRVRGIKASASNAAGFSEIQS